MRVCFIALIYSLLTAASQNPIAVKASQPAGFLPPGEWWGRGGKAPTFDISKTYMYHKHV